MGEEAGDRLGSLLRMKQSRADVVDAAKRLRGEHGRQGCPERVRRGDRGHLHQHLFGEIVEQVPEHLLILPDPDWVERVGRRGLLPVFVLGDEESGRLRCGAVGIAEDTGAPQLRHDLCTPQNIVRAGKLLCDLLVEVWVGGTGGRHG